MAPSASGATPTCCAACGARRSRRCGVRSRRWSRGRSRASCRRGTRRSSGGGRRRWPARSATASGGGGAGRARLPPGTRPATPPTVARPAHDHRLRADRHRSRRPRGPGCHALIVAGSATARHHCHMVRLFILLAAVQLVLLVLSLISCLSADRVRNAPRFVWVLVILFIPLLGPLAYFAWGRPRPIPQEGTVVRRRRAPAAPDDDPDFLRSVDAGQWGKPRAAKFDDRGWRRWREAPITRSSTTGAHRREAPITRGSTTGDRRRRGRSAR